MTFKHPNMADHVYFRTFIPGRDLAVRYVDTIFSIAWSLQDEQQFRQNIHQSAMEVNRQPPLVLPGITVYAYEDKKEYVQT
uniref:Uncharacterized protein n=1 Tax=Staphylococcus epidermidis TaxID=1282 RepID=A0A125SJI4_STAEP|nr:hypothetical protein [Staphylococcus epidermidis]